MKCPLPTVANESLHQGIESLIPKCRECKCYYVEGNHPTEYIPSGCILLVVALLDPKRSK